VAAVFANTSESIKNKLDSKWQRHQVCRISNIETLEHSVTIVVASLGGATVTIFPLHVAAATHDTGINEYGNSR
jgi:P2-related tail formation protein